MTCLLTFSVGGIDCAIPNVHAQFVVQMIALLPADASECGERECGNANIEGRILPVYSLRQLLGLDERPPRSSDVLIVAEAGDRTVALWADETSDVTERVLHVEPAPPGCPSGLQITKEGVVIIQDLPNFLKNSDPAAVRAFLPDPRMDTIVETEDPDRVRVILEKRAKKMSRPVREENKVIPVEILKFRLANREYALSLEYIREVILTGEITPVPGTPGYIPGICAIRGEIVSLVDLREFFGIRGKGLTDLNRVIVVTNGKLTCGILADFITGTGTIMRDELAQGKPGQVQIQEKYLLGVVEDLIVLDAPALLADPGLVINDARG